MGGESRPFRERYMRRNIRVDGHHVTVVKRPGRGREEDGSNWNSDKKQPRITNLTTTW
jgi:hypothetical protein